MGLADAFGKDDRIELRVATVMDLLDRVARAEASSKLLMNGIKCDVPHSFIREVITGEKEEHLIVSIEAVKEPSEIHECGEEDPEEEEPEEAPEEDPLPIVSVEEHKPKNPLIKKPIANGTKYAPLTQEKIDRIKELAREGKTVKEIVEETGVSDPTVRRYKREVTVNDEPMDSDE